MEKKTLDIGFEVKQIAEEETESGKYFMFEGYLSTFGNIDHGNDVIVRGAFRDSLSKRMPSLLWQHNMQEPIGVFTEAYEDEKGLFVKGKLPVDDDFVRGRVMPQMKVGSIKTMSIGYYIESMDDIDYDDAGVRRIKKLHLLEGSLVTIPMNDRAQIFDMKTLAEQIKNMSQKEKADLLANIEDLKYTYDEVAHIATKKDFERFLRDAGVSRKAASFLMSKISMQSDQGDLDDSESVDSELKSAVNELTDVINEVYHV